MRWFTTSALAGLGAAAALLLAGCGNSEVTISGNESGMTFSAVVASDSTGISLVKQEVKSESSSGSFSGATVSDGDTHSGNQICSFTASKNGHSYTVTFYASNLPAGVTSGMLSSTLCAQSTQQSFVSSLPS
jgi:hypothetical protein